MYTYLVNGTLHDAVQDSGLLFVPVSGLGVLDVSDPSFIRRMEPPTLPDHPRLSCPFPVRPHRSTLPTPDSVQRSIPVRSVSLVVRVSLLRSSRLTRFFTNLRRPEIFNSDHTSLHSSDPPGTSLRTDRAFNPSRILHLSSQYPTSSMYPPSNLRRNSCLTLLFGPRPLINPSLHSSPDLIPLLYLSLFPPILC